MFFHNYLDETLNRIRRRSDTGAPATNNSAFPEDQGSYKHRSAVRRVVYVSSIAFVQALSRGAFVSSLVVGNCRVNIATLNNCVMLSPRNVFFAISSGYGGHSSLSKAVEIVN